MANAPADAYLAIVFGFLGLGCYLFLPSEGQKIKSQIGFFP